MSALATVDRDAGALGAPRAPAAAAAAGGDALRARAHLLDALSYAEPAMGAAEERAVAALVEAEMARGGPRPRAGAAAREPRVSEAVAAELARVARGEPAAPLDVARYACEAPGAALGGDPRAWRGALDNARAQLSHQAARVVNLELAEALGPAAWARHAADLARVRDGYAAVAAAAARDVERVNLARRAHQGDMEPRIARAERAADAAATRVGELESAVAALKAQVAALEPKAAEVPPSV